ncbi:MAG: type II toxin-antitoxin system VapC family toxin [Solirubrobacteraceae bacterium]
MTRLLVDTHALLWWLTDDAGLSNTARGALADPANDVLVSAASVWEIAIRRALGKLEAPDDLPDHIAAQGFGWLPVAAEHAGRVRDLPPHHRDPFARLLVAQALSERMAIVSADARFGVYGVETRW